ncbi:MAG TPA: hypothetical protein EYH58_00120 [Aquifex aeolicus]|nr:hypothetical protein [Aquifex aeolicus]
MERLRKGNFKFLEHPFTIWGLEVFDILLAFLISFPIILLAFLSGRLYLTVLGIILLILSSVVIKKKKEGKAYGYTLRFMERSIRKLLRKKKIVYP